MSETSFRHLYIDVAIWSKSRRSRRVTTLAIPIPASIITDEAIADGGVEVTCHRVSRVLPMEPGTGFGDECQPKWRKERACPTK